MVRPLLALALCGLAACNPGTLVTGSDDADVTATPDSDRPDDGPCATIVCPADQTCVEGRCLTEDLCSGVECSNPGEVCDPRDGACHAGASDDDGDGVTLGEGDCDDGDATIYPGAAELCDGVDQDCDLEADDGFVDGDGDGFDSCGHGNPAQADCDDARATVAPGLAEACDGLDNDCDGTVDDGVATRPCSTACGSGTEQCTGGAWVCSAPATCECSPAGTEQQEGCGNCGTRRRTCQADLRWSAWSDCTGQGECSPGDSQSVDCGDCGTQSRSCSGSCSWGSWSSCSGTRGCERGFVCEGDGSCVCGPYPHWQDVGAGCQPSCGVWLGDQGYSNEGAGCCPAGCLGAGGYGVTHDCAFCCESPPGCA
jgi:hypothetical protein